MTAFSRFFTRLITTAVLLTMACAVSAERLTKKEEIEINKALQLRESGQVSVASVPFNCVPGSFANLQEGSLEENVVLSRFGDTARLKIWRQPCAGDDQQSAVVMRIQPISGNIFVCSSDFVVVQNNVQYDSVRLINANGGSSFCGNILVTQTFLMDQWSFDAQFNEDGFFRIFYDEDSLIEMTVGKYEPPSSQPPVPSVDRISLEEPVDGSVVSGISNLRGWAVSSLGVSKIEIFIDGQYAFEVPYGGQRTDVESAFPEIDGSLNSGFGQTYNYNDLGSGSHTITARATTQGGAIVERSSSFVVVDFGQEFISNPSFPSAVGATASVDGSGAIIVQGVTTESGDFYSVKLRWSTATQGYEIAGIEELPKP